MCIKELTVYSVTFKVGFVYNAYAVNDFPGYYIEGHPKKLSNTMYVPRENKHFVLIEDKDGTDRKQSA